MIPNESNFDTMLTVYTHQQVQRIRELDTVVNKAHLAMVDIGNDLNWEYPADQQLADAINACRFAHDTQQVEP